MLKEEIESLRGPIVVFGAGGFIGANLFRQILSVRSDCYAVTHQSYTPWRLLGLPAQNILHCDVRNELEVQQLIQRFGFPTYFYLSAFGAYSRQTDRTKIFETNVLGLIHVLNAAESRGFSAFVHAGSSSEYGLNCTAPKEDGPLSPNSNYAVSKVSVSYLLKFLGEQNGLPVVNLRYYSVYGPWEESDRLVPRLVEAGMRGKLPPLVAPETTRDFVYVDDAVKATILAATKGVLSARGASINIASGKKTEIREIAEVSRKVFNVSEEPKWGALANRGWDTKDWVGDATLAKEVLGWSAETDLETGLRKTWQWTEATGPAPKINPQQNSEAPLRLSAIIACYRDAQAIPIMHERLTKVFRELQVAYEILFVNDASPDNTREVLAELCEKDPHVLAIEHTRNFGSQSAFLSGMEIATGDSVILMDGDLQDPPELIPQFFEKWREGYDVIYGVRIRRETSSVMQVCYKAFYRLFRKLAYVPIPLDAGDFSLIDSKVVEQLVKLPETDQFLRGLRAWVGFRQTGVEYVRPERLFGVTTNNWRKNFWWARKAIFNFSFLPLDALLYLGITLTAFAGIGFVSQLFYRIAHPELPHGITTIVLLILLFGGGNILAISILGEYLSKVFEETKRRPKFIRRSVRSGKVEITEAEKVRKFISLRKPTLAPA